MLPTISAIKIIVFFLHYTLTREKLSWNLHLRLKFTQAIKLYKCINQWVTKSFYRFWPFGLTKENPKVVCIVTDRFAIRYERIASQIDLTFVWLFGTYNKCKIRNRVIQLRLVSPHLHVVSGIQVRFNLSGRWKSGKFRFKCKDSTLDKCMLEFQFFNNWIEIGKWCGRNASFAILLESDFLCCHWNCALVKLI